jgi:uncharacterized membrane protein YphA (DoxX/SURF4 family)
MAFAFIWPGLNKLSDPSGIGEMIQTIGLEPLLAIQLATFIGTLEIVSGLFIAVGFMTRPSAIFQIVILVGAEAIFQLHRGTCHLEGSWFVRTCHTTVFDWWCKV